MRRRVALTIVPTREHVTTEHVPVTMDFGVLIAVMSSVRSPTDSSRVIVDVLDTERAPRMEFASVRKDSEVMRVASDPALKTAMVAERVRMESVSVLTSTLEMPARRLDAPRTRINQTVPRTGSV